MDGMNDKNDMVNVTHSKMIEKEEKSWWVKERDLSSLLKFTIVLFLASSFFLIMQETTLFHFLCGGYEHILSIRNGLAKNNLNQMRA